MVQKFAKSLMERIIELVSAEHKAGNYIYTLDEAAKTDEHISSSLATSSFHEVRQVKQCLGEAQAEMLYESADMEVAGLKLTQTLKHAIFIDYLEQKSTNMVAVCETKRVRLKLV